MRVYWVSRHELSPAQRRALEDLHKNLTVIHDPQVFGAPDGLLNYIKKSDGFVYAVAGAAHYLTAALAGARFGIFENDPAKRANGSFGLSAVYHVADGGSVRCG